MTTRDSQKQRVYDAERCIQKKGKAHAMTIAECQAMVDKMLASAYVQRHYPIAAVKAAAGVRVIPGRNGGWATGYTISLGVWGRQPVVVIHEFAHILVGARPWHGWEFCECMLRLVRHFLGADVAETLEASYRRHRVRFAKPRARRTLTPEQRAAAIANLTAVRAPGTTRPTFTPNHPRELHTCRACGFELRVQKFPTTRTPGVREEICRGCRDDHAEWT